MTAEPVYIVAGPTGTGYFQVQEKGMIIAAAVANRDFADMIVNSLNNSGALIDALENALSCLKAATLEIQYATMGDIDAIDMAEKALAKAKGK